jgi:hypothetical protein
VLRRRIVAALIVALAVLLVPTTARADSGGSCDKNPDPSCITWGGGGSGTPGGGGSGGSSGGGCTWQGKKIACTDPDFGFYMGGGCYWRAMNPPPDAPPPMGQDPKTGVWGMQSCYLSYGSLRVDQVNYWMKNPNIGPTPAQLAQDALAKIHLLGAQIGIEPNPNGSGLVGLPVWMWTAKTPARSGTDATSGTWGPLTASASGGGITVTITARAHLIIWTMGDGHQVKCPNPGTAYRAADGNTASPTCGYTYTTPSSTVANPHGRYTITATTYWTANWAGGGLTGVLNPTSRSQTSVQIGEVQVVTQ